MVSVCVATLCRYDLLRSLLLSLTNSVRRVGVYLIDNGDDAVRLEKACEGFEAGGDYSFVQVTILPRKEPGGLAQAWNRFIASTHGERIIANDDVLFSPRSVGAIADTPGDLVCVAGVGFSCFLIRDSCVEKVGLFDESLSPGFAYFEDCDYMERVRLCGGVTLVDAHGTGVEHLGQGTQRAKRTDAGVRWFRQRYYVAQENYLAKWGKLPDGLRRMTESECA